MRTSRGSVRWACGVCADGADLVGGRCPDRVEVAPGFRQVEHIGSAHSDVEVELLKAAAAQRIAAGQDELPLRVASKQQPTALEITGSRMGRLLDVIGHAYRELGLDAVTGRDQVFEQLVTARLIETHLEAGRRPGIDRGRDQAGVVSDRETTPAGLRHRSVARSILTPGGGDPRTSAPRLCCSTMSPPCGLRPTPGTGSKNPGSARNADWSLRSRRAAHRRVGGPVDSRRFRRPTMPRPHQDLTNQLLAGFWGSPDHMDRRHG